MPRSISVNGEPVRIGGLAAGAATISLKLGMILDQRLLLVVPPRTAGHAAAAAMVGAAATGNHTPASELLRPDAGSSLAR